MTRERTPEKQVELHIQLFSKFKCLFQIYKMLVFLTQGYTLYLKDRRGTLNRRCNQKENIGRRLAINFETWKVNEQNSSEKAVAKFLVRRLVECLVYHVRWAIDSKYKWRVSPVQNELVVEEIPIFSQIGVYQKIKVDRLMVSSKNQLYYVIILKVVLKKMSILRHTLLIAYLNSNKNVAIEVFLSCITSFYDG